MIVRLLTFSLVGCGLFILDCEEIHLSVLYLSFINKNCELGDLILNVSFYVLFLLVFCSIPVYSLEV